MVSGQTVTKYSAFDKTHLRTKAYEHWRDLDCGRAVMSDADLLFPEGRCNVGVSPRAVSDHVEQGWGFSTPGSVWQVQLHAVSRSLSWNKKTSRFLLWFTDLIPEKLYILRLSGSDRRPDEAFRIVFCKVFLLRNYTLHMKLCKYNIPKKWFPY